jgi:glycosidase
VRITDTADLWYKTAVVYCLDVETYLDADGDGTGDLQGLAQRLDHLASLGVTCLWLMPVYPTPDRDDGYDIVDFYGVDPRLGSLGDFVEVVRTAKDPRHARHRRPRRQPHRPTSTRGSRRRAAARTSPYRDWYVWRDEPPGERRRSSSPTRRPAVWEHDEKTGQYYLHRFYKHQPDLNVTNPGRARRDREDHGLLAAARADGFRVDAVPFFLGDRGRDAHALATRTSTCATCAPSSAAAPGDGILLGEVNLPAPRSSSCSSAAPTATS